MAEWSWVGTGYTVVYATMAIYAVALARRLAMARRRLGNRAGK